MTHVFEEGKIYTVNHSRKGTFTIRVTHQSDEWVHGEIIQGTAQAMLDYNVKEKGEDIGLRKEFIRSSKPFYLQEVAA